jgi:DnaJ-class molecular chaperone
MSSHYQTLGVAKTATPDEIKKAYRKLASKHHPDKGGDTATFQKIQTAYDTLIDPNKKNQYDNPSQQFNFHDLAEEDSQEDSHSTQAVVLMICSQSFLKTQQHNIAELHRFIELV